MATTYEVIIFTKFMENATVTQYSSSAVPNEKNRTIIDKFTVTNVTPFANLTFDVHIVNAGDAVTDTNKIIDARPLAVGETYDCPELVGVVLAESQSIATFTAAENSLVLRASGRFSTT